MTPADVELMAKKVDAERKRIRRRVGYGLRAARGWAALINGDADQTPGAKGLAGAFVAIDAATKAPKRGGRRG